jgi:hypothetical protein
MGLLPFSTLAKNKIILMSMPASAENGHNENGPDVEASTENGRD